jgi:putative spermidine/putrescine transport system ATP-binding protein
MSALATSAMNDPMVKLEGVSKNYGAFNALQETSLSVEKGEFLTLLGPSGSGKTTLLNVISGMQSPTQGKVFINGNDVTAVPPSKRGLGMVFQNYALMPHMTVFENIAFPLQIRRVGREEIKRRVSDVLGLVGLSTLAHRKPKELSGGQQQRVSIARCLVYDPSLILMDEPLGALDKKLREQMQIEIKRLHVESGITIMYVTHDQEEALNMSDRIMLMKGGQIEQLGTPGELYSNPVSVFAADFIGESSILDVEVVETGETSLVKLRSTQTCRVHVPDPKIGLRGKLLLRPESLRIVEPGDCPENHNVIAGVVTSTLTTGGSTKHFVRLSDNDTLIVQELTNQKLTRFSADQQVEVIWPVEAGMYLDR